MDNLILLLIWIMFICGVLAVGCWLADRIDRIINPELYEAWDRPRPWRKK